MNYYQHHIGDFNRSTRHLTRIERSIYRDLIDMYYDTEQPIPIETDRVSRRLRLDTELVDSVLREFFTLTDNGWENARCNKEIERYHIAKKNHWGAKLSKDQRAAIQGQRNASKVSATPSWLTKSDKQEIAAIYAEAATLTASTGIRYEVDHIVPLRSKVVCGLHVPLNLQVLQADKNRQKSNRFEVT